MDEWSEDEDDDDWWWDDDEDDWWDDSDDWYDDDDYWDDEDDWWMDDDDQWEDDDDWWMDEDDHWWDNWDDGFWAKKDTFKVQEKVESTCRKQTMTDKVMESGCINDGERLVDGKFCCTEHIQRKRHQKKPRGNSGAYWKIQNSWGTGWGDDGFIYLSMEGGNGTCGVNVEVLEVSVI